MRITKYSDLRWMFILPVLLISTTAHSQRGTGDHFGIAQRGEKPLVQLMKGTLKSVATGPCEKTTGRSLTGTHLLLDDSNGAHVNLHLGPSSATEVKSLISTLQPGSTLEVMAFQTNKLPKDQFIAKSITVDGKTTELRDLNLRPLWAGKQKGMRRNGVGACY